MNVRIVRLALLVAAGFFGPGALHHASAQQVWQVTLIRVDAAGERELVAAVEPLKKHTIGRTDDRHRQPFVVTGDNGTCLGIYVPINAAGVRKLPTVVNLPLMDCPQAVAVVRRHVTEIRKEDAC